MGKKYTAKDVDEFNFAMEKKGIDEQMRFDAINKKFPNYFTDSTFENISSGPNKSTKSFMGKKKKGY